MATIAGVSSFLFSSWQLTVKVSSSVLFPVANSIATMIRWALATATVCYQRHGKRLSVRVVLELSHSMAKPKTYPVGQAKTHEEYLDPKLPKIAQRRLIRLGGCQGWSESSLGTQAILLVLSRSGSIDINTSICVPFQCQLHVLDFHTYFIVFCLRLLKWVWIYGISDIVTW